MSQTSISRAANDADLQARVQACIHAEAFNNEAYHDTRFGEQVRGGFANWPPMYWAIAVAVEQKYESGILNGRGAPGHDRDVISDDDILAAVQAHWPMEEDTTPVGVPPATTMTAPTTAP